MAPVGGTWRARRVTVVSLGKRGAHISDDDLTTLIQALDDPHRRVRQAAATSLGQSGAHLPEMATIRLLRVMTTERSQRVRCAAAAAQRPSDSSRQDQAIIAALVHALHDPFRTVRTSAVEALGRFGARLPAEGIQALVDVLRRGDADVHPPDSALRHATVVALAHAGPRAIAPLTEILGESYWPTRCAALRALGSLAADDPDVANAIASALGDSEPTVRREAITALHRLNATQQLDDARREAEAILASEPAGDLLGSLLQGKVVELVASLDPDMAAPQLVSLVAEALSAPYWQVQWRAARALGNLPDRVPDGALRRLRELRLGSTSRAVREAADDALAAILDAQVARVEDNT